MSNKIFWEQHLKKGAVLNPVERIAEVLFGLIMVLTFTGAISGTEDTRPEIRDLLRAAIKCNIAWGLIDAVMYLMNVLIERGHSKKVIMQLGQTQNKEASRQIIREEIQPLVATLLSDAELDRLAESLKSLPVPNNRVLLNGKDMISALEIFFLVFLCTLPVALPFALLTEIELALKVSNGVAILLLFVGGYKLAKYAGFKPFITALVYTLIGVILVLLTIDLGG